MVGRDEGGGGGGGLFSHTMRYNIAGTFQIIVMLPALEIIAMINCF